MWSAAGGTLVELVDNFRSRPEILSAVETMLDGRAGHRAAEPGGGAGVRNAASRTRWRRFTRPARRMKPRWVARRILELAGPSTRFRDVAVLVRNTEVIGAFTAAFEEAGIPYIVNRGRGFYETREVNDLTHLLRVIANPRDEISLAVVLRSPLVGVSDEALLALRTMGGEYRRVVDAAGRGDAERVRRGGLCGPATLPRRGCARGGCGANRSRSTGCWRRRSTIAATGRHRDRAATPISISSWRRRGPRRRGSRSTSSSSELAQVRADNPREPDAPPEDAADAVKVMTVHSAKGLEFPVVFVAAMHKGIDNSIPVVAFSPAIRIGRALAQPGEARG